MSVTKSYLRQPTRATDAHDRHAKRAPMRPLLLYYPLAVTHHSVTLHHQPALSVLAHQLHLSLPYRLLGLLVRLDPARSSLRPVDPENLVGCQRIVSLRSLVLAADHVRA